MTTLTPERCPVCGDAWKWPGTEECYSCHEEEAYFNERSNAMIYGEPGGTGTHPPTRPHGNFNYD